MEKSGGPSAAFLQELRNRSGRTLVYATDVEGNVFASLGWSGDAAEVAAVEASQNSSVEQTVGHLEAAILQKMWAQLEGVTGYGKRDKADDVSELAVVIQEQRTASASRGTLPLLLQSRSFDSFVVQALQSGKTRMETQMTKRVVRSWSSELLAV